MIRSTYPGSEKSSRCPSRHLDRRGVRDDFQYATRPGEKIIQNAEMGFTGIVMGKAYTIHHQIFEPDPENVPGEERAHELRKFKEAYRRVLGKYHAKLQESSKLPVEINDSWKDMIEADLGVIKGMGRTGRSVSFEDINLDDIHTGSSKILQNIQNGMGAHAAVHTYLMEAIERFQKIEPDNFFYGKDQDYIHMLLAFQAALNPQHNTHLIEDMPDDCVPVVQSVAVGDLIYFRKSDGTRVHGMVNCAGTDKDHVNIICRSSQITVSIIPEEDLKTIRDDDVIIIDGPRKLVILNPAKETIAEYKAKIQVQITADSLLAAKSREMGPCTTLTGKTIRVGANTGYCDDMHGAMDAGADEVSLHRTELGVLLRKGSSLPDEDKWHEIFSHLVDKAQGKAVTLRTVDFEGDKIKEDFISLANNEQRKLAMVADQMRAMLRVRSDLKIDNLSLMVPMVRSSEQLADMQQLMDQCARELNMETVKIGCMVETPTAIHNVEKFDAAFFSIGTNDLIPFTIGYDRFSPDANSLYDPTNSLVLESLQKVAAMKTETRDVCLCGDMATDPRYLALVIGCGIEHLSSGVSRIPLVKELITRIDENKAVALVEELKSITHKADRDHILDQWNEDHLGLLPNRTLLPKNDAIEHKTQLGAHI